MEESWRTVCGFEWEYEVSNHGRIRSWMRTSGAKCSEPHFLTLNINSDGRPVVNLAKRTRLVHQLVLESFVGPRPNGLEAFHIDDDKHNNRTDNLRWATHAENMANKIKTGRNNALRGEDCGRAKFTDAQIAEMRKCKTVNEMNAKHGVSKTHARRILTGQCRNVGAQP